MKHTIDQIMDQDCAKAQNHNHSIEVIDQWIIESKELQEAIIELEFLIDGPISAEKQNILFEEVNLEELITLLYPETRNEIMQVGVRTFLQPRLIEML